jgi:hypothetical protein
MTAAIVALVLAVTAVGIVAVLLSHRRRRLRQALEVLAQLDDERRARASAERRLARAEAELRQKSQQLERATREEARAGEVELVRRAVASALPAGAGPVAVVSRGDDELVSLPGHVGWHFPQTDDGVYTGYHPADSDAAIRLLEEVRRRGARHLLVPESSSWWLDHYVGFRDHLATRYHLATDVGPGVSALVHLDDAGTLGRTA